MVCKVQIRLLCMALAGSRQVRRRPVPRTSLSRMLFPAFCALWARLPFAVPLVCGSSLDAPVEARLEGAEGSKSGKTVWLISTRGASDMVSESSRIWGFLVCGEVMGG